MNREAIYAAAFALFNKATGCVTASRTLQHWSEVQPEQMPALFQTQVNETNSQERGIPTKWTLRLKLYLYVHSAAQLSAPGVPPSSLLNPLLDAIEAVLMPTDPQTNACTLGGLVSRIWIDGTIETDEGVLGDIGVCIIPISIVVPT